MQASERWTSKNLPEDQWIRQDFGSLGIVVLSTNEEWRVGTYENGAPEGMAAEGTAEDEPMDVTWERWDRDPKDSKLQFRPVFPDMPVVARPRCVLNLSPKGKATFLVGIPAWIEILAECQGKMIPLTAIPTENLSKTWHGSPLAGQLGYSLRTFARRNYYSDQWPPFEVLCSISIVNEGEKSLPFERLYLETDHLALFEKDDRLWSNAARIRIAAQSDDMGNITYATRPFEPNEDATEITAPRKGKVRRSAFENTFAKVFGQFNSTSEDS